MKNLIIITVLLSGVLKIQAAEPRKDIKITILYDNYLYDEKFRSSWGFSCLVEGLDQNILFDCGGKEGNLLYNFRAAGLDPAIVDLVVLSHIHWDHTGGLSGFLEARSGIDVWIPESFPDNFLKEIEEKGAHPVPVTGSQGIIPDVWTTGEMGSRIIEQSLVIETGNGLIVITGCAHPGIEEIVTRATEISDKDVYLVMGGFHLLNTHAKKVREIAEKFKEMGIGYAGPTHCSGDQTLEIFREVFKGSFVNLGAGRILYPNEL